MRLLALPETGDFFELWGNAASGNDNPLSFAITYAAATVSCVFGSLSAGQVSLTVIPNGSGLITVNPRANAYSVGATITLTPMPDAAQDFINWNGDAGGTQNPLSVSMTQSKIITANFTKRPSLRVGTPLEGLVEVASD